MSAESDALLPTVGVVEEETNRMDSFKVTMKIAVAGLAALALVTLGVYNMPATDSMGNFIKPTELYVGSRYGRNTGHNANSGQIIYLDRHNVDCGNDFISQFRGSGAFSISYNCMRSSGLSAGSRGTYYSGGWASGGQHNLNYLDRVNVYCPNGQLMQQYRMNVAGGYRFRYQMTCAMMNWRSLSCSSHSTGWNTYSSLWYLDRHNVECGGSKALQGFDTDSHNFREYAGRYWWWGWRNRYRTVTKIKYNYRCCSMTDNSPTAYPVARPTAVPISNPTAVPISNPTANPISDPTESPTPVPIADPTEAPIATPTEEPVANPTMAPTINMTPLLCKMKFTQQASAYTDKLGAGCALVSLTDIGWEGFSGEADGIMLCGSAEVADFAKAGLSGGISYIHTAKSMTATTYSEANYKGTKHFFDEGMPSVVHDHNDDVNSIQFVSTAHDETGVPTECAQGTKIDGVAKEVEVQEELNEVGKADKEADAAEAVADEAAEKA